MSRTISNPYINTILTVPINLHPYQMNNNIYSSLKGNLETKLLDKCYKDYGYVCKIIEILKYEDGIIEAENVESSARFMVEFSCKLCLPNKGTTIVATVDNINQSIITAVNGPIIVIIANDRINGNVFFKDNNNNIRYDKDKKSVMLKPGDHIKVTITGTRFYHGNPGISAIGILEGIPTENEVKDFFIVQYKE